MKIKQVKYQRTAIVLGMLDGLEQAKVIIFLTKTTFLPDVHIIIIRKKILCNQYKWIL